MTACIAASLGSTASADLIYRNTVLADSPGAYLRLGESSGTVAADISGNSRNGTYLNGVSLGTSGAVSPDTAASFDGVNDYVNLSQFVGDDFSLEMWVRTTSASRTGSQAFEGDGLIWSDVGGAADDYVLGFLNNRAAFFTGGAFEPGSTISSTSVINDGDWHHVVATRERGGQKKIYVDGVLEGTGAAGNRILNANSIIAIGANVLDNRYFDGDIDEVAIYTSVLSDSQVLTHYNAAFAAVPEPGSVALLSPIALALLARRRRRRD